MRGDIDSPKSPGQGALLPTPPSSGGLLVDFQPVTNVEIGGQARTKGKAGKWRETLPDKASQAFFHTDNDSLCADFRAVLYELTLRRWARAITGPRAGN